jgi:hypothetical protein
MIDYRHRKPFYILLMVFLNIILWACFAALALWMTDRLSIDHLMHYLDNISVIGADERADHR